MARGSIRGRPRGGYATEFERELSTARKKAGRVIGPRVRKERIDALQARNAERMGSGIRTAKSRSYRWRKVNKGGKISPIRRSNVKAKYDNKDGLLVMLDLYPYAMEHEDGAVQKPKTGKYLFIQDKRRRERAGDKTFVTKKGYVMAVKPWRKWSGKGPKPKNTGNQRPRLIGVLKKQVTIKPMKKEWRLDEIAARHLDDYRDEIEKNIYGGNSV